VGFLACRSFGRAAITQESFHLLCHCLLVRRAEHARGVDAVLLGELAGTNGDSSLVEDVLHCLKDVLSAGRRRGIRVLLATHHHLYNFA
jgi:hypothetical protein